LNTLYRYAVLYVLLISSALTFSQEPVKILFVGSSYFNYNNLPVLFKQFSLAGGKHFYIDQYMPSGLFLSDHASQPETLKIIRSDSWDYVILQGSGPGLAYPDSITDHPVYPALKKLKKSIHKNNPASQMVFTMPWAFEDGMTWKGWDDDYLQMQQKIEATSLKYAGDLGFMLAPVGVAWSAVLKEKSYPMHYLHFRDWNHPTKRGSYLMACVLYSTIFRESCADIDYSAGLDREEALYFRERASEVVLDSLQLWNIPEIPE
jgi:hypothetical protein